MIPSCFERINYPRVKNDKLNSEFNLLLNGKITPKEFIEIGDFLILKCPSFKWNESRKYIFKELPKDKQYLNIIINSHKRIDEYFKIKKTKEK